eukprot:CAMPEP_0202694858 /NCGR_PEP_ID=MMETSP1385-20130828/8600_1 /ASSEMBLY_ACC=CAM_ASM_000861 /TAXON_ID=933848 /ORGANISM="Elphidium margaritaceum" /LENGTH=1807 /DNA_ID=CAMNT_0049350777 /DNA_START=152 /DNA_END=5575 /DNA_ORIENTATION=-
MGKRTVQDRIGETHLEQHAAAYVVERRLDDKFLKNTEDLIQEISTHSKWQHYETRYLLSQFRKIAGEKEATALSEAQFLDFVPTLVRSLSVSRLETHRGYKKWLKHLTKLFANHSGNDQITFQSFANRLSIACRGEHVEKAEFLFDLFDMDRDGALNHEQLDLFLCFILNVQNETEAAASDNHNHNHNNAFDINKIISKTELVEFVQDLIAPPDSGKATETAAVVPTTTTTTTTTTNGHTAPAPIDGDGDGDGNVANADGTQLTQPVDDKDKDTGTDKTPPELSQSDRSKSSSQHTDSERVPLTNGKNGHEVGAQIDFIANLSLSDLAGCDDKTLVDTVENLLKNKLYNKNKLKQEAFVPFAAKCINFDHIFASFMIIPTRDDERRMVKQLMQDTQMTLDSSWFVLNKDWWDKWCAFSGYTDAPSDVKSDDNDDDDDDAVIDASHVRGMRPIKISNRELLDENSIYTVLRKELQLNNQFILVPKAAWQQLHEWYGGGPAIERKVICTDKATRMEMVRLLLPKLHYEYEQQNGGGRRKTKTGNNNNNNNNAKDEDKDKDTESVEATKSPSMKKNKKDASFDEQEWRTSYDAKLQELSMLAHPDTLCVDLYPIYVTVAALDEKHKVSEQQSVETVLSRYTTLQELYLSLCASMGYLIEDISRERANYEQYLQNKLQQNTKHRNEKKHAKNGADGDNKKNKNKEDSAVNVNATEIVLPPRLWRLRRSNHGPPTMDSLLYPIPKLKRESKQTTSDDGGDKLAAADTTTTSTASGEKDVAVAVSTEQNVDKPETEAAEDDANTTEKDKTAAADDNDGDDAPPPYEAATTTTDVSNLTDVPAAAAAEDNAAADDVNADNAVSNGSTADTATNNPTENTDKTGNANQTTDTSNADKDKGDGDVVDTVNDENDDDLDLFTIGVQNGQGIAIEFAVVSGKKNSSVYEYKVPSIEEDAMCEPEIDGSWLNFEVKQLIDARDRWGKWYPSQIMQHKAAGESMPKNAKLQKSELAELAKLEKLEAILVHYAQWDSKWDEWVFLRPDTVCTCRGGACSMDKADKIRHRIAPYETQSKHRAVVPYATGSSRYSQHGTDYSYGYSRMGQSQRGAPGTAGCVGLVNMGNTCFMNCILQCLSNTPHFTTFFTSGQYKQDINKTNPLGMKGELAHEFAKLISDVWSGEYRVIAPKSLKRALCKFAPQFAGFQQHDSQEFLTFLLDGLHEDLNLVKTKPYTEKIEANDRSDEVVAGLSWKIHLKRNKSKIVDLFQAQQKSHVICPECGRNSITFDTYTFLSLPIVGQSSKSLIIDVFHRRRTNPINKPIRHVFHVKKHDKVRDLAKSIAKLYDTKESFVLFYENYNMRVAREYNHDLMIGMVPDREALACYILKDWNEEVTLQEIREKKLKLEIAKVSHSMPLVDGHFRRGMGGSGGPLFGMPFVLSHLNVHTRRELHQLVYERLFTWVGAEVLKPPPTIVRLQKIKKKSAETKNNDETTAPATENANTNDDKDNDKDKDKKNKKKEKEDKKKKKNDKKKKGKHAEEAPSETEEEEDEYDYIRPSEQDMADYETAWDELLQELPYRLRVLPYRYNSFYSMKSAPEEIPIDDITFLSTIRSKDAEILIEWGQSGYEQVKTVVNKVVVDADYSKWKKEKAAKQQAQRSNTLSLYDCLNSYVAQETLGENDMWYCSECKKHQHANKKLDFWSFPEILIVHLKRFQILGVGRFVRGEKINTFVDCPVRGLDLSPYVSNKSYKTGMGSAPIYDLYAVSCHSGSCGGGHYTAYGLNAESDRWFYFNDSSVRPAKESDIVSSSAYVLFYKKCH